MATKVSWRLYDRDARDVELIVNNHRFDGPRVVRHPPRCQDSLRRQPGCLPNAAGPLALWDRGFLLSSLWQGLDVAVGLRFITDVAGNGSSVRRHSSGAAQVGGPGYLI